MISRRQFSDLSNEAKYDEFLKSIEIIGYYLTTRLLPDLMRNL